MNTPHPHIDCRRVDLVLARILSHHVLVVLYVRHSLLGLSLLQAVHSSIVWPLRWQQYSSKDKDPAGSDKAQGITLKNDSSNIKLGHRSIQRT